MATSNKFYTMNESSTLVARPIMFDLPSTLTKNWVGQDDVASYHFNALALFLPTLERLVILTLKRANKSVTSPTLKKAVHGLLAQEATHSREFERLISTLIYRQYHFNHSYKLRTFRFVANILYFFSKHFYCGFSAAAEHFTAIAGALCLSDSRWSKNMAPEIAAMMRWHSIEEIEHKSVVFDVYQHLKGGYIVRILSMLLMMLTFFTIYFKPFFKMAKNDGKLMQASFYRRLFQFYWGKSGWCRKLFWPLMAYFKPSFHPCQQKTEILIEPWLKYFKNHTLDEIAIALRNHNPPT